jgi:hypothetical protein
MQNKSHLYNLYSDLVLNSLQNDGASGCGPMGGTNACSSWPRMLNVHPTRRTTQMVRVFLSCLNELATPTQPISSVPSIFNVNETNHYSVVSAGMLGKNSLAFPILINESLGSLNVCPYPVPSTGLILNTLTIWTSSFGRFMSTLLLLCPWQSVAVP